MGNKVKVGLIINTLQYVVDRLAYPGCELYNFSISPDKLSFSNLFDSAFATPARYIMEIWKRLTIADSKGIQEDCFIFNPLFEMDSHVVRAVIDELSVLPYGGKFVLVSDCDNTPIGYLLPSTITAEESKFLSLLSTMDGVLDKRYLDSVFITDSVEIVLSSVTLKGRGSNNFSLTSKQSEIYRWTTENAIDVLSLIYRMGNSSTCMGEDKRGYKKGLRDKISFAAIMPYQAGDALFFSIAANHSKTHFSKIVIHKNFKDIISENLPGFEQITISSPLLQKDGVNVGDEEYLRDVINDLPKGNFYYYCRPSRSWYTTNFHLIDKFAFALGTSCLANEELIGNNLPLPPVHRTPLKDKEFRILLHFDAGWPLKIYPQSWQKKLIELLCHGGFLITVLSTEEKVSSTHRSVIFKGLSQFKELLLNSHILVGMDSFPVNYAVNIVGLPTICLYSSTNPVVSKANQAINYRYLAKGLPCNPCDCFKTCQKNQKDYCENFVEPDEVFTEIVAMLQEVYK